MAKRGDIDRPAFTETLRAIDDLSELDVYEFRLLVHLWRVGVSWESVRTLAGKCNMSIGKTYQAQKALLEKGYLVHQERAGRMGLAVAVGSQGEQVQPQERSPREQTQQVDSSSRSLSEHECSPHEQNVHHMNAILNQPLKSTNEDVGMSDAHDLPTDLPEFLTPAQVAAIVDERQKSGDPVVILEEYLAGKVPGKPNRGDTDYDRYWRMPILQMVTLTNGDTALAKSLIDAALDEARKPKAKDGKPYRILRPSGLLPFFQTQLENHRAGRAVADDDALWQRAVAAVTRRDFTDERLKAAIRAIGGTGRIASANGHDTETLKRSLGHAYRNVAAA